MLKKTASKGKTESAAEVAPAATKVVSRGKPAAKKRIGAAAAAPAPARVRTPPAADAAVIRAAIAPALDALRDDIRGAITAIERLAPPRSADAAVEAQVDALRRVLSDLIEQRTESVVRTLVEIRTDAAGVAAQGGAGIVDRLERLLQDLGAVRFEAEAMDVVDPLIHVVVGERQQADAPDGVILETVRPGYRTARGAVVSKAAVVVNQRS
ncbi:MAG: nucleotide exchange factor GrpE [Candidatus Binatia bacterium]